MADERLRELERQAAAEDSYEGQARLVRELVRRGVKQEWAERRVWGRAEHDVLGWTHPRTGTNHVVNAGLNYATFLLCGYGYKLAEERNAGRLYMDAVRRLSTDELSWWAEVDCCGTCTSALPGGLQARRHFVESQALVYGLPELRP